ncbi:MAG: cell division protein ZapA [Alphaproteobacteria bacterium]|nr:cell division protein ZapA [Alphaproteobacteria bacterium]
MPEKQVRMNNKGYLLNYGAGQEEQLDRLIEFINQRIKPYAQRFSEYSESYLLLLVLLELSDELDQTSNHGLSREQENRLKILAQHAKTLVKEARAR